MKTLTEQDFCRAAKRLRCEVAAIQAVAKVESAGNGFYSDGFPVLLYERHLFRKFTGGKYNNYPELSGSQGNYGAAGANQRRKFSAAFALDPDAAMKSCSWGKFQILGSNHKVCGYSTVGKFVDAMKESEGKQLDAFVEFVIGNNLDGHLRTRNWAKFARGYNGPKYAQNQYDIKMAKAYSTFAKKPIDCNSVASNVSTDTQSVASTDNHSPEPSPEPQAPPTNSETVTETVVQAGGTTILQRVDQAGDKLQSVQGTLDKFGFSVEDAKRSLGTVVLTGFKGIGAVAMAVVGVVTEHWELFVIVGLLAILAYLLWDRSGRRVAEAKAGVPVEIAKELLK